MTELSEQLAELRREMKLMRAELDSLAGRSTPSKSAQPKEISQLPAAAFKVERKVTTLTTDTQETRGHAETATEKKATAPAKATAMKEALWSEKFIGERLLHYLGMALLAIGIVFFLVWRAAHTGPHERVLMAAIAGAVLVGLGVYAGKRPPYDNISETLTAGGWTVLALTAYASYHFPATKIIESAALELLAVGGVVSAMVAHALSSGSTGFRRYGFGLGYAVLFLCRQELTSFDLMLLVLFASTLVAAETGHADAVLISAAGYYLNYLPFYFDGMSAVQDWQGFAKPFLWLGGAYLIVAALPFLPRARRLLDDPAERRLLDLSLCLNTAAFALLAGPLARHCFPDAGLTRGIALAAAIGVPGLLMLERGRELAAVSASAIFGLMAFSTGALSLPSPMMRLAAWSLGASLWVWIGLIANHKTWRVAGLLAALLTFAFYAHAVSGAPENRVSASAGMLLFSAVSYLFSRFYRLWLPGELEDWEKPAMEYWLYVGSAALVLSLWGFLDPSALPLALLAAAIVGELAAVRFGRPHLWAQACAVQLGAGLYSFAVDPGAAGAVLSISPRLLTGVSLAAGYYFLVYADPTPESFSQRWTAWSKRDQRVALSWLALAVLGFAVYHEFEPRLRVPIWAVGASALYLLGRLRAEETPKLQSIALGAAAAWSALFSYYFAPSALSAPFSSGGAALYWLSALLLLGNFVFSRESTLGPRSSTDAQAGSFFSLVGMGLIAVYFGKELDRVQLTLAWSAQGMVFLFMGFALGAAELRYPALSLLGFCALKALLIDSSQLPLPYRVASFVALGLILLGASTLYVRAGTPSSGDRGDPAG